MDLKHQSILRALRRKNNNFPVNMVEWQWQLNNIQSHEISLHILGYIIKVTSRNKCTNWSRLEANCTILRFSVSFHVNLYMQYRIDNAQITLILEVLVSNLSVSSKTTLIQFYNKYNKKSNACNSNTCIDILNLTSKTFT